MNDRSSPNNLHSTNNANTQDSVEARLARAAQQLDTAAANYAYRTKTEVDTSSTASRLASQHSAAPGRLVQPRRRFAPFAAIGGAIAFAGSLVFGASVISNQAEKPPVVEIPIEISSPTTTMVPTSDFPFVGKLSVSLPSTSTKSGSEEFDFVDGVAISQIDQRRVTLAGAIDIDIDADGTQELAVLINTDVNNNDGGSAVVPTIPTIPEVITKAKSLSKNPKAASISKNAPSKLTKSDPKAVDSPKSSKGATTEVSLSAVAIVRVVGSTAKTLATTPTFDTRFDALLMNRNTLWAMRVGSDAPTGSEQAILQRGLITTETGRISWAAAESPIARTALPLIVEGDTQIRFNARTSSALVFAASGTRRGWFTAKAGQTLTIGTIGIPSNKKRQIALLLRKGSNDQQSVSSGLLPGPLSTVLPHGGDYEILVGEGGVGDGSETTFELSIK